MRGWRFKLLRLRYALWVACESEPAIAVRNFVFWLRRPRMWLRFRRYVAAHRAGQRVIEA